MILIVSRFSKSLKLVATHTFSSTISTVNFFENLLDTTDTILGLTVSGNQSPTKHATPNPVNN